MLKKTSSLALALIIIISISGFAVPGASAADLIAMPTTSTVLVDAQSIAYDAYNIGGNNYFKLRDLAYTLNGTAKQFEVEWDAGNNAISLTGGKTYTPVGGEMAGKGSGNKTPIPTSSKIYMLGREVYLTAYNIDGNNYFKLRDIGQVFDFGVDWDGTANTIAIDTNIGYMQEGGGPKQGFNFNENYQIHASRRLENYNLSLAEKRLYDQITAGIENFDMRIEVDSTPQMESDVRRLERITIIAFNTHPEFFWWDNSTVSYTTNGKKTSDGVYSLFPRYSIDGRIIQAGCRGADNEIVWPSESEIAAGRAWIEKGKAAIRDKLDSLRISNNMNAYELELAVHDWLWDNTVTDELAPNATNIFGGLAEGRAHCKGISKSFQYILGRAGIECVLFEGYAPNGEEHMWVAVKLDGQWYQTDATWDISSRQRDNLPWHFYFNRTDSFMTGQGYIAEHPIGDINPQVRCTASAYDYFNMTNSHIASDSDFISKVPERIAMARAYGEWAFELEFDPSYASPGEITYKIHLIDSTLWEDISFYVSPAGMVFCLFDAIP